MSQRVPQDLGTGETYRDGSTATSRHSVDSISSMSSTSAILEHMHASETDSNSIEMKQTAPLMGSGGHGNNEKFDDEEEGTYRRRDEVSSSKTFRRVLWLMCALCLGGWLLALFLFLSRGTYKHASTQPHDPLATASRGSGKAITFDSIMEGQWYAHSKSISWIETPSGEDGMVLEEGVGGKEYLVVEDVRSAKIGSEKHDSVILMKESSFQAGDRILEPSKVFPSPDLKKVLIMADKEQNWRHSSTGTFWVFDVESQSAEPLDPDDPDKRIQLATWSPTSKSIAFTRDNNLYLRRLDDKKVVRITEDGGPQVFYGVPDWVYEEEVFAGNRATWWSDDGEYLAFLRTNETQVPEFPVQYFLSRPSGKAPKEGLENYPEVRRIKYPKAGAPNPLVNIKFYDVKAKEVFDVKIEDDYADDDRLITEVVWAGKGKVLVRETNRVSDTLKVVLADVERRTGKTVRTEDVKALDGGWFEVSESTTFVPSDPGNGRPHDGYVDTVIYKGYDHIAYFTPTDNPEPIMLSKGSWEVVDAPSSVDLKNNLVYFVAAKRAPGQRHIYSVKLDGTDLKPVITDDEKDAYYAVSFSTGSGYALLSYKGPGIPSQKVTSTPSLDGQFDSTIEENQPLSHLASKHELPIEIYSTVEVEGVQLNVLERRPPHFNPKKKYPVVFQLYQGPGSQQVDRRFQVDFQSYLASNLGFVVVTVDGRGTGLMGRDYRCVVRGNIGHYEAHDQIAAAKLWKAKSYIDPERMAIWGWSYGGFMTLKVLETDAGETFKYGVAVAPVTDWRFYDSVYTERYMFTPQDNPAGYDNTSIANATALGQNVRFLVMHGSSDDNVHFQNSLTLLDELDLAGVENYDFHAFPDSDHSIYFHNASKMVHGRKLAPPRAESEVWHRLTCVYM
jgi:dipeptidyl aminopeptidase